MSRIADAYAKQMQNATCRMQMQNALQMQIALQIKYQKDTQPEISNGLRARGAGPDLRDTPTAA